MRARVGLRRAAVKVARSLGRTQRGGLMAMAFLLAAASPVAANLISNGSFEMPGFEPGCSGRTCATNYQYLDDGDTRIAGWTVTRTQSVGERPYWYHVLRYPVFAGSFAVVLTDGSRVSTSVTVEAGQRYRVTFVAFRDLNPPISNFALSVSLGASQVTVEPASATDTGVPVDDTQNWLRYEVVLQASTTNAVSLAIENLPDGITSADGGVGLDAVEVERAAAPGTCDVDGDGHVGVSDGVNVLRAAADLSSTCGADETAAQRTCDVDGDGHVGVSDGVNVLRAAADLSSTCAAE
jgi:Protein of unknown function (DUF642)